ncbi:MAG: ATP-binding protein [Candidatus Kapabacteria bacterium]|nr:ATP-binding protein [Candidatus Kapabacteria bacterium]
MADLRKFTNFVNELILGKTGEFVLEEKLSMAAIFFGLVVAIIGTINNVYLEIGFGSTMVPLTGIVVFSIFYFYSRVKKKARQFIIPFYILCYVILTIIWFFNAGYDSPNLYLFFITAIIFTAIFSKKGSFISIIFMFILISSLFYIHKTYPQLITPYQNSDQKFWDIYFTGTYCLFIIYFLIYSVVKSYKDEREKVEKANNQLNFQKLELELLNSELSEKIELIKDQNIELETLNNALTEKNIEITNQKIKLEQFNDELSTKNTRISMQNTELEHLNEYLSERNIQISEQKTLLEEREVELSKANATKDKFFSIIAHDLKNPIHGVMFSSDLLLKYFERLDHSSLESNIKNINKLSRNLSDLLENLLQWSRVQSNRIEFYPEKFNLYSMINKITDLLSFNAEIKNIEIKVDVIEDTELFADSNMINTIIRNLLTNAIKFTNSKGIISIKHEQNRSYHIISVTDSGIGISEETLPKMFTKGFAVTTYGTNNEKGTGLGLHLCKEFVDMHHGDIRADSKLNNGTTITFSIPFKEIIN